MDIPIYAKIGPFKLVDLSIRDVANAYDKLFKEVETSKGKGICVEPLTIEELEDLWNIIAPTLQKIVDMYDEVEECLVLPCSLPSTIAGIYFPAWGRYPSHILLDLNLEREEDLIMTAAHEAAHHLQHLGMLPETLPEGREMTTIWGEPPKEVELVADGFALLLAKRTRIGYVMGLAREDVERLKNAVMKMLPSRAGKTRGGKTV